MTEDRLLTPSIIVRLLVKELGDRVRYTEDVSPFHSKFDFDLPRADLRMQVNDFWDIHVRPAVHGALCYAGNGSGFMLELPPKVEGARASLDGVEVRFIMFYDIRRYKSRARLDARYPA